MEMPLKPRGNTPTIVNAMTVELQRPPEDASVAFKSTPPESVAEDGRRSAR